METEGAEREHILSAECWCEPHVEAVEGLAPVVAYLEKRLYQIDRERADWKRWTEESEAREASTKAQKDNAYSERDQLVAALSKVFPAHLCRHSDEDTEWENDWRWIVCIHIPEYKLVVDTGRWEAVEAQVTWHIHDDELSLFGHLSDEPNHWDGHTTEDKYRRLARLDSRFSPTWLPPLPVSTRTPKAFIPFMGDPRLLFPPPVIQYPKE